jgi:hypothetical protein
MLKRQKPDTSTDACIWPGVFCYSCCLHTLCCCVSCSAGKVNWASRVSEENSRLLQVQNPSLASEETWAHATTQPEIGGLLLATRDGPAILNTDKYWQVWFGQATVQCSAVSTTVVVCSKCPV